MVTNKSLTSNGKESINIVINQLNVTGESWQFKSSKCDMRSGNSSLQIFSKTF